MKKFICLYAVLVTPALLAQEAVVTLSSTVSGSQEQPRVMYIVPWQHPGDARFDYQLQGSLASELFAPIDRDEFVRGLAYREMLSTEDGKKIEQAADSTLNEN